VTLASDAPDGPATVTLRGTGASAVGAQLWVSRYDGPGTDSDVAHDVALSPDGATAHITGRNGGDGTLTDYVTVAYDTATGSELWIARYDGPASKTDEALALGLSPDGSHVFVTGGSPARERTATTRRSAAMRAPARRSGSAATTGRSVAWTRRQRWT
jgi:hypothetical protein